VRPSWDTYFLNITELVRSRSTCLRRTVGALLVRDKRILTTGYNGPPPGMRHCEELGGCLREQEGVPSGQRMELCRAVHAEANALLQAAIHGVAVRGAILYSTTAPCSGCAKLLISAGVKRVVYIEGYPDEMSAKLLSDAGAVVEKWSFVDATKPSICSVVPDMPSPSSSLGTA
jgi:dCMP deaminase